MCSPGGCLHVVLHGNEACHMITNDEGLHSPEWVMYGLPFL